MLSSICDVTMNEMILSIDSVVFSADVLTIVTIFKKIFYCAVEEQNLWRS